MGSFVLLSHYHVFPMPQVHAVPPEGELEGELEGGGSDLVPLREPSDKELKVKGRHLKKYPKKSLASILVVIECTLAWQRQS